VIESIFDIGVRRHSGVDFVPTAQVQKKISRRVIDVEAVKVGVRAWTDKAAAEISTPTRTKVREQRSGGVPGPTEKRIALRKGWSSASWSKQNLRGSVRVRRVQERRWVNRLSSSTSAPCAKDFCRLTYWPTNVVGLTVMNSIWS